MIGSLLWGRRWLLGTLGVVFGAAYLVGSFVVTIVVTLACAGLALVVIRGSEYSTAQKRSRLLVFAAATTLAWLM